ncbi:dihydrofolate reductase family protein [Tsukamurella strandjordii]|uniref:Dihydrofolate reductase family protein n=1 Tax=Tsukamurella strandjordii TaxID=147577 RepID=A0AA90NIN0_9ACTN|nr:dihydrofolate reductase family protein [Tsukamurella strandjordii]MDP0399086.1 dihydrofolate reductase family protein [Tsukamurella strandjordii]
MTDYRYYTASTLDGFLADENDSLDWLLSQPIDQEGPQNITELMKRTGAIVMGYTTYQWVVDHIAETGDPWMYAEWPTFVFTHRDIAPVHESVSVVAGSPAEHRARLESAAGDKGVWVVGGGDLATQFASDGMLDELIVSYAPVTVGAGRPLFTGPFDFELIEWARNQAFLIGRYRVVGPRT